MMATASLQQLESRVASDLEQMQQYVCAVKEFGSRQAPLSSSHFNQSGKAGLAVPGGPISEREAMGGVLYGGQPEVCGHWPCNQPRRHLGLPEKGDSGRWNLVASLKLQALEPPFKVHNTHYGCDAVATALFVCIHSVSMVAFLCSARCVELGRGGRSYQEYLQQRCARGAFRLDAAAASEHCPDDSH